MCVSFVTDASFSANGGLAGVLASVSLFVPETTTPPAVCASTCNENSLDVLASVKTISKVLMWGWNSETRVVGSPPAPSFLNSLYF